MARIHRDLRSVSHFCKDPWFCGSVRELARHGQENVMKNLKRKLTIAGITASCAGLLFQLTVGTSPAQNDTALIAKAKGIHDRVIKLDTHNDIEPSNFTPDCTHKMRLTTQVNLPKMVEGDMDVSFMIAYVGQGPLTPEGYDAAYKQVVSKFDAVHR